MMGMNDWEEMEGEREGGIEAEREGSPSGLFVQRRQTALCSPTRILFGPKVLA